MPQGSILGPLLFSANINDLPSVCDGVENLMYADDTVLHARGRDLGWVVHVSLWILRKQWPCIFWNKNKWFSQIIMQKITKDSTLAFKRYINKMCHVMKYIMVDFRHIRNLLHKQALKVLDRKSRQYHHCDILVQYKMLNFGNSTLYSDVCLVHMIIHNAAPPEFTSALHKCFKCFKGRL